MSAGEIDLQPGERVLWAGEPVQRPFFTKGDLFTIPLTLVLLGAATAFFFREPAGPSRIGLTIFMVLCLCSLVGRPVVRYVALGKTTYALTDGRVIARSGLFRMKETSGRLAELAPPVITPGKPGTGTITFGELSPLAMGGKQRPAVVLVGVGEPKRVRSLLTKAIEEARRREPSPEPGTPAL